MRITIISLLPSALEPYLQASMMGKAQALGLVSFELLDLRDFGQGPRQQIDDTPYGGGPGMILRLEPLVAAIESLKQPEAQVILLTPRGETFNQDKARQLADQNQDLILICGRYEGYDERISHWVNHQISVGNYVLTGGEVPALAVTDAVVRLLPGVLGATDGLDQESFDDGQTPEYPQYTKPASFRGLDVPPVLLSGHHQEIKAWRQAQNRPQE